MFLRMIIMLLIVAAVVSGVYYLKMQQWQAMSAMMAQGPPPATIATSPVQQQSWQPTMSAVGSLVAVNGVSVTNEVDGIIDAIDFDSGQRVEKGDVLLHLDDDVDQAELVGLQAELQLAKVQYERASKLVGQRTIAQSEFDEATARLASARANVASKKAVISKKTIRAPFSGLLGIRQVDLGEYLAAGSEIVPLQSLDPIFVDYSLPERYLADLAVGQVIEIQIESQPEQTFRGEIKALNPGIDPGTRSVQIRAVLDNPDHQLRPGMFAQVETLLPVRNEVLTVPQQAVSYAPYGNSVFVVVEQDGQKIATVRQVETGVVREGQVEIVSGLQVDDMVVSAGHNKLRNGQPVQIDNSIELNPEQVIESP